MRDRKLYTNISDALTLFGIILILYGVWVSPLPIFFKIIITGVTFFILGYMTYILIEDDTEYLKEINRWRENETKRHEK